MDDWERVDQDGSTEELMMPRPQEEPPEKQSESVVVCIDRSWSMGTPLAEEVVNEVKGAVQERSRMEAVKGMFYAFRDRVGSVGGIELGLLAYDDKVDVLLELTADLDEFERVVDDIEKRGQTAIFSAVVEAVGVLEKKTDPKSFRRIVCLTDGQNNCGKTAQEALSRAIAAQVVVDAIVVGQKPDAQLLALAHATGGERYFVQSLGDGFELLEKEDVVSLRRRHDGERPPVRAQDIDKIVHTLFQANAGAARPAQVFFTPCQATQTPVATERVCTVQDRIAFASSNSPAPTNSPSLSGPVAKRLMKELVEWASSTDPSIKNGVHVFPTESNVMHWRAVIQGPANSPFAGGAFALRIVFPDVYPFKPASIAFMPPTVPYHCNVNERGGVCVDVLKDSWTPALTTPKVLCILRDLLAQPRPNDALRSAIAELTLAHVQTNGADRRYYTAAQAHTLQHASASVDQLTQRWFAPA